MKSPITLLLILLTLSGNTFADDERTGYVIVNSQNKSQITAEDVKKIFLGKRRNFKNGVTAIPLDNNENKLLQNKFYRKVLKKSPSQYRAYWAKILFTSKGKKPLENNDDANLKSVIFFEGAITFVEYIEADLEKVRVVMEF